MIETDKQIFEQIEKANRILITFSNNWSGDAIASSLAFYLLIKKLGKEVEIVAEKNKSACNLSFLPSYHEIKTKLPTLRNFIISLNTTNANVEQLKYKKNNNNIKFVITPNEGSFTDEDISSYSSSFIYDLIISLDSPDFDSLGKIYEKNTDFFYKTPLINIDHSPSNEEHGQINLIDLTAVSTSEILFENIKKYDESLLDDKIATCLLAGMISKTKSFKTNNITPRALANSANLISAGANRELIVNKLYRSRPFGVLKLWGRVLARLTSTHNQQIIYSLISLNDFQTTQTKAENITDVIEELIVNIPEAKAVIIIYETKNENGKTSSKGLIYSIKTIDSLSLLKEFNPVGNKTIAIASFPNSITETEKIVKKTVEKRLNQIAL